MRATAIQSKVSTASNLTLAPTGNRTQNRFLRRTLLLVVAALVSLSTSITPATAADPASKITAITQSGSDVHIHVTSAKRFPARAMRPLLHIGKKTFRKSMPAPGGSVNDLVFVIPAEEYAALKDGDAISVDYEGDRSSQQRWKFGALEKQSRYE